MDNSITEYAATTEKEPTTESQIISDEENEKTSEKEDTTGSTMVNYISRRQG